MCPRSLSLYRFFSFCINWQYIVIIIIIIIIYKNTYYDINIYFQEKGKEIGKYYNYEQNK